MKPTTTKKLKYTVKGRYLTVEQLSALHDETRVEALHLNEDILAIKVAIDLLKLVEPWNFSPSDKETDRENAYMVHRRTLNLLRTWERNATSKLRRRYLSGAESAPQRR